MAPFDIETWESSISRIILDVDADREAQCRRLSGLEEGAWTVRTASSRVEALRLIYEERPDVALVGMRLADAGGPAFCRELKSALNTAGIAVTMFLPAASYVEALRAGADATLDENTDGEHLRAVIEALIAKPRARAGAGSGENFLWMFEQANIGVGRRALGGRVHFVNDRLCAITGYSHEELLQMNYLDFVHPDDRAASVALEHQLMHGRVEPIPLEKRYVRKSGEVIDVRVFVSLLRGDDGSPNAFLGFVEDITAKKRAEREAQRQMEMDKRTGDLLTRMATSNSTEIDESISAILRALGEHCGCDHVYVLTLNGEDTPTWRMTHEWRAAHVPSRMAEWQAVPADAIAWTSREMLRNEAAEDVGAAGILHVPMVGRVGRVVGCLGLHKHAPGRIGWNSADEARLNMVGNGIAAILERQRVEECLRFAEAKFEAVFNACPQPMVISSVNDQTIVDANPSFVSTFGYTREEMLGKTTAQLGVSIEPAERTRGWAMLLEQGSLIDYAVRARTKAGAIRDVILSSVVVTVQNRQYAITIVRDVTDLRRRAAFDELMARLLSNFLTCPASCGTRATDISLELIANYFAADHVVLLDLFPAEKSCRVAREWCAPGFSAVQSERKPAQRCMEEPLLFSDTDIMLDIGTTGAVEQGDIGNFCDEGARVVLNVPIKGDAGMTTARISLDRHRNAAPWTVEDASRLRIAGNMVATALQRQRADEALRESEQHLRALADASAVMSWISDANGGLAFYSRHALKYAGVTLDDVIGDGWIELVHPDDRESYVSTCYRAADAQEPLSVEARFRRADGEYRWILVTGFPRFVEREYRGHIGTGIDITELKRSYEHKIADQKLQSLGVLAAGVAHNVNNVLASIIARADCARSDLDSGSEAAEHIDEASRIAVRGAEMVAQLLAFASEETEPFDSVDLSQIVTETIGLLRVSTSPTTILRTELPVSVPQIRANVAEMRQVVFNLLMNGVEALEQKTGTVAAMVGRENICETGSAMAPAGAYVRLEVLDTGCGMTEETKTKIFDPFFSTKFMGRGLGLAVVQGIVRRHNGYIGIESSPGEGSRFTVLLPCAEACE